MDEALSKELNSLISPFPGEVGHALSKELISLISPWSIELGLATAYWSGCLGSAENKQLVIWKMALKTRFCYKIDRSKFGIVIK